MFVALVITLALTGFGCKKQATPAPIGLFQKPTNESAQTKPWAPDPNAPRDLDNQIIPEIEYLRQVMRNFTLVNSFRAKITSPFDDGIMVAQMEAEKGHGIHAFLHLPNNMSNELYLVGDAVYVRNGTSTWQTHRNTEEATRLQLMFAQALFAGQNTTSSKFISDSSRIVSVKDTEKGCKEYAFTQYIKNGSKTTLSLCVKNDLPSIMTVPTTGGDMVIEYSDYNQSFNIQAPAK